MRCVTYVVEYIYKVLSTWWVSLLVDKGVPEGTCSQFYGRLRLICSVLRASKFVVLKFIEIVILWVYYTIPFGFSFFRHFWDIIFQPFQLLSFAKDHWRGFNTRNAHMFHIVKYWMPLVLFSYNHRCLCVAFLLHPFWSAVGFRYI